MNLVVQNACIACTADLSDYYELYNNLMHAGLQLGWIYAILNITCASCKVMLSTQCRTSLMHVDFQQEIQSQRQRQTQPDQAQTQTQTQSQSHSQTHSRSSEHPEHKNQEHKLQDDEIVDATENSNINVNSDEHNDENDDSKADGYNNTKNVSSYSKSSGGDEESDVDTFNLLESLQLPLPDQHRQQHQKEQQKQKQKVEQRQGQRQEERQEQEEEAMLDEENIL